MNECTPECKSDGFVLSSTKCTKTAAFDRTNVNKPGYGYGSAATGTDPKVSDDDEKCHCHDCSHPFETCVVICHGTCVPEYYGHGPSNYGYEDHDSSKPGGDYGYDDYTSGSDGASRK